MTDDVENGIHVLHKGSGHDDANIALLSKYRKLEGLIIVLCILFEINYKISNLIT